MGGPQSVPPTAFYLGQLYSPQLVPCMDDPACCRGRWSPPPQRGPATPARGHFRSPALPCNNASSAVSSHLFGGAEKRRGWGGLQPPRRLRRPPRWRQGLSGPPTHASALRPPTFLFSWWKTGMQVHTTRLCVMERVTGREGSVGVTHPSISPSELWLAGPQTGGECAEVSLCEGNTWVLYRRGALCCVYPSLIPFVSWLGRWKKTGRRGRDWRGAITGWAGSVASPHYLSPIPSSKRIANTAGLRTPAIDRRQMGLAGGWRHVREGCRALGWRHHTVARHTGSHPYQPAGAHSGVARGGGVPSTG